MSFFTVASEVQFPLVAALQVAHRSKKFATLVTVASAAGPALAASPQTVARPCRASQRVAVTVARISSFSPAEDDMRRHSLSEMSTVAAASRESGKQCRKRGMRRAASRCAHAPPAAAHRCDGGFSGIGG